MKRRTFLKTTAYIGIAVLASCKSKSDGKEESKYVHYLEPDLGKTIDLEGEILHLCPVDGLKMKLRLPDGEIISVLAANKEPFSKEWYKKKVRVSGKLERMQLSREFIAANFKEKKILCHIDHTPCTDIKWIENRWKDNSAENILNRDNKQLEAKMRETKCDYIHVYSILSERIDETI